MLHLHMDPGRRNAGAGDDEEAAPLQPLKSRDREANRQHKGYAVY